MVNDWLGSSAKATMTVLQQGAYRNLLDWQWQMDDCMLPADQATLASLSGLNTEWGSNATAILRHFIKHEDGRIYNPKLRQIWGERCESHERRVFAGKSGGFHKHKPSNASSNASSNATVELPERAYGSGSGSDSGSSASGKGDARGGQKTEKVSISLEPLLGWVGISDEKKAKWSRAYPACDIDRQLEAMKCWVEANPQKGKKSNWERFIVNWLSRKQDSGGDKPVEGRVAFGRTVQEASSKMQAAIKAAREA
jgi:uncharacterized protein YdaU (DUF1376 family)